MQAMSASRGFAYEALLVLDSGTDPAAPGGAVTVALCGQWDHEGPCAHPHNNAIDTAGSPARFRTVFVADDETVSVVSRAISDALRAGRGWTVRSSGERPLSAEERALAERLAL
jgi:hypothetical protein